MIYYIKAKLTLGGIIKLNFTVHQCIEMDFEKMQIKLSIGLNFETTIIHFHPNGAEKYFFK